MLRRSPHPGKRPRAVRAAYAEVAVRGDPSPAKLCKARVIKVASVQSGAPRQLFPLLIWSKSVHWTDKELTFVSERSRRIRARKFCLKNSAEKAADARAVTFRGLCDERLLLIRDFTNQPANREAIGITLEENRQAQKLVQPPAGRRRRAVPSAKAKTAKT
jgi:hypothetical protein